MNFITTYTGERFTPLNPNIYQINIDDIAHSLSLICRGNGHQANFYSVAQHGLNLAKEARARRHTRRVQMACLLRYGSTAYLPEIIGPVKSRMPMYKELEEDIQNLVYVRFLNSELLEEEMFLVREIVNEMLVWEANKLINKEVERLPAMMSAPKFGFVDFVVVEEEFKSFYESLIA
jgi:hypothetical protein